MQLRSGRSHDPAVLGEDGGGQCAGGRSPGDAAIGGVERVDGFSGRDENALPLDRDRSLRVEHCPPDFLAVAESISDDQSRQSRDEHAVAGKQGGRSRGRRKINLPPHAGWQFLRRRRRQRLDRVLRSEGAGHRDERDHSGKEPTRYCGSRAHNYL